MKNIAHEVFLDKVHGCWYGKCLGGAAGAPLEGVKKLIDIGDFTEVFNPDLPNDDLDLQLLWIDVLKNKGYNIYILSDLSKESYEFNSKFGFFKDVDGGVFSFEINSTKPNENNYKTLLERFNLVPEETIFVDDKIDNIEAANKFKIKGIVFTNLEEVKFMFSPSIEWFGSGVFDLSSPTDKTLKIKLARRMGFIFAYIMG